jgi:hypothetical protein
VLPAWGTAGLHHPPPPADDRHPAQRQGGGFPELALLLDGDRFYGKFREGAYKVVVQQFTAKLGVEVKISVEIEVWSKEGFDEALQRTIKENCNMLRFGSAEFEEN